MVEQLYKLGKKLQIVIRHKILTQWDEYAHLNSSRKTEYNHCQKIPENIGECMKKCLFLAETYSYIFFWTQTIPE